MYSQICSVRLFSYSIASARGMKHLRMQQQDLLFVEVLHLASTSYTT